MKEQTKLNDKTRPSNTPRGGTPVRVQQTQPLTHLLQLARERPEKLTAVHLTQLQSVLGNRAVNRLVNQRATGAAQTSQHAPSLVIQPKLQVNAVGDKYEQEADAVAKEVVQKLHAPQTDAAPTRAQRQIEGEESIAQHIQRQDVPEKDELQLQRQEIEDEELQLQRQELEEEESQEMAMLQREAAPEEEELQLQRQELPEEEEIQLQRQALEAEDPAQLAMTQRQPQDFTHGGPVDSHIEAQINQSRGGGQPMEDSIRQPMEQAFGADFSDVRIHTDTQAHNLNEAIQARAFTTGNDIYFKKGEYSPSSNRQELLAHELTHIIQRVSGKVQRGGFPRELPFGRFSQIEDEFLRFAQAENSQLEDIKHRIRKLLRKKRVLTNDGQLHHWLFTFIDRWVEPFNSEGREVWLRKATSHYLGGTTPLLREDMINQIESMQLPGIASSGEVSLINDVVSSLGLTLDLAEIAGYVFTATEVVSYIAIFTEAISNMYAISEANTAGQKWAAIQGLSYGMICQALGKEPPSAPPSMGEVAPFFTKYARMAKTSIDQYIRQSKEIAKTHLPYYMAIHKNPEEQLNKIYQELVRDRLQENFLFFKVEGILYRMARDYRLTWPEAGGWVFQETQQK